MRDIAALLMGFGANPSAVDVAEVFCPGRLAEHAHLFGLTPGLAADLGTGWDLSTLSDSGRSERVLEAPGARGPLLHPRLTDV